MLAARVANPQPHIGKIYHLIGPQSENMHVYAQYSYLLAMIRGYRGDALFKVAPDGYTLEAVG